MSGKRKTLILDSNTDTDWAIKEIIEKPNHDEPFFICDVSDLISNVENWKKLMPRVDIFYGFDCASKEEIRVIDSLGVSPNRVIFSNPAKLVSHLRFAKEIGVTVMTFDSESELYKIKEHHPNAELLLRIRCDDDLAKYKLGEKFGVDPDKEPRHIFEIAKSLELNIIGIHFHVGSGSMNDMAYYNAIRTARKVFDVGTEMGYQFKLLDIGGGYASSKSKPLFKVAGYINKALDEYFPDDSVKIVAEPGKYCCNTAFKLVTQIHSKKILIDEDKQSVRMYYLDISIFTSLFGIWYNEFYVCRPVNENKTEQFPSILWGASTDTKDKITEKYDYLPELHIGDWIVIEEAGGYTLSVTSEYNGIPSPRLYTVIKKDDWLKLTKNVPKPISKDRYTTSLIDFLEEHDVPFSFRTKYF